MDRLSQLKHAEILLVRSVTRVNRELLIGTPVRFIGTATSGIDHIDTEYLAERGIEFAAAPGANAIAVAEYIVACTLAYCVARHRSLGQLRLGIVGYGYVGTEVVKRARMLGIDVLINDPPRAARDGSAGYCDLGDALAADIVSLHVPLTVAGANPTLGLIGAREHSALAPDALLINTARGGVLDEPAWLRAAPSARRLVVDCWCDEPAINRSVLASAWLATPHIAGHTVEARRRATTLLAEAVAKFLGVSAAPVTPSPIKPPPIQAPATRTFESYLDALVRQCCDLSAWTLEMQRQFTPAANFDRLRRQFGVRREFASYTIRGALPDPELHAAVHGLGFQCDEP